MSGAVVLDLAGLTKTFPGRKGRPAVQVLEDVSLVQREGEFLAVMGPSGCGKSTLLNIVAGFDRADRGTCLTRGQPVLDTGPDRGVVFQEYALFPWMTVERNLQFAMRAAGKWTRDAPTRIDAILGRIGLEAFRDAATLVVDGGVVDAGRRLGAAFPTLRSVLAAGALARLGEIAGLGADHALAEIEFAIPVPDPSKIICIGRNYRGHLAEAGMKLPEKPSVFIRTLESFVPHNGELVRPIASSDYDYEGELCLVIGSTARHVARADALSHIAGYTCMNEACLRDFQFNHSLTVGKNFYHSGSIGPWMVTSDEIPDPTQLMLHTRLNGQEVQHTQTDDLIFDIPEIIRYLSVLLPLNPGDIIATGTPEGVGFTRTPPLWLRPGDQVEVDISGIGVLHNHVVAET